ncbi:UNVERIFIED_CONTAM: hypothetical protein NCL1_42747 [Trichonephila clavipes]
MQLINTSDSSAPIKSNNRLYLFLLEFAACKNSLSIPDKKDMSFEEELNYSLKGFCKSGLDNVKTCVEPREILVGINLVDIKKRILFQHKWNEEFISLLEFNSSNECDITNSTKYGSIVVFFNIKLMNMLNINFHVVNSKKCYIYIYIIFFCIYFPSVESCDTFLSKEFNVSL